MDTPPDRDVTKLLRAWTHGDDRALSRLTPIVHNELRKIARRHLRGERSDHSLQATALVNEAYLRLVDCRRMRWQNRAHFFAMSAQLMRRILVDHARRQNLKRGAGFQKISLQDTVALGAPVAEDLVALDDALRDLARFDPRKARVIELRFFAGLSVEEIAEVLKISAVTVMRDWSTARAWLYREMKGRPRGG